MIRNLILLFFLLLPCAGFSQKIDLLLMNREFDKAIAVINERLREKPSAELYYQRSLANKQLVDYPAALRDLNKAVALDSFNVSYLTSRADLYQSLGNYERAVMDYTQILFMCPENLQIKYELGKAYLLLNDDKKASQTFEEIQLVDSLNVMYNKYSALAAFKADRYERALVLYEKYILQNPDDLSAYGNLSSAYVVLGRISKSVDVLKLAWQRFPNNRICLLKYANALFVNKDFQLALTLYRQYLDSYDASWAVRLNYGICLYHNKYTEEAIEILEKCYEENPSDVFVNFYLGVCNKRLDHYELAANYIDFAIRVSVPDFQSEMYHHLAQVYGSQREFEKSIDCYRKAYEQNPDKVEVLFEIATTYEEYNFNKTLALNYYRAYLKEAGEQAENAEYALMRIEKIKEDLFFEAGD